MSSDANPANTANSSTADLLARIVAQKEHEVALLGQINSKPISDNRPSFSTALRRPQGSSLRVIAECKKASPSHGLICADYHPDRIAAEYRQLGAAAISVLTDTNFFQGDPSHIKLAAECGLPILRKDFIISEKQISEAVELGASAVLLIVRLLEQQKLSDFIQFAADLGLDTLVETHDEEEIERAMQANSPIIGINHRNLNTLKIDLSLSTRLAPQIRKANPDVIIVAESGIEERNARQEMEQVVDAVLVGNALMRSENISSTWRSIFD